MGEEQRVWMKEDVVVAAAAAAVAAAVDAVVTRSWRVHGFGLGG